MQEIQNKESSMKLKEIQKHSRIYDSDYRKEFKAEAVCGKTLRTPA